jgi:hypothetical protein
MPDWDKRGGPLSKSYRKQVVLFERPGKESRRVLVQEE